MFMVIAIFMDVISSLLAMNMPAQDMKKCKHQEFDIRAILAITTAVNQTGAF